MFHAQGPLPRTHLAVSVNCIRQDKRSWTIDCDAFPGRSLVVCDSESMTERVCFSYRCGFIDAFERRNIVYRRTHLAFHPEKVNSIATYPVKLFTNIQMTCSWLALMTPLCIFFLWAPTNPAAPTYRDPPSSLGCCSGIWQAPHPAAASPPDPRPRRCRGTTSRSFSASQPPASDGPSCSVLICWHDGAISLPLLGFRLHCC